MSNITVISTLPTTATEAVVSAAASALTSYLNNSTSHSESLLATALSVVSSHASKKIEFHPNISHKIQYKHHTSIKYDFSPVTLSSNWSRLSRLLILSCLSVIGSVGNVFMISSLLIEEYLKRAGEFDRNLLNDQKLFFSSLLCLYSFSNDYKFERKKPALIHYIFCLRM